MTYSSLPTKITLMCFSKNFNPYVKDRSFKSINPNALYSPEPTLPDYRVDEIAKILGVNLSLQTQGCILKKEKAFKILADGKRYFTKFMSRKAKALIMKIFILTTLTHLLGHMKINNEVLQEYKKFTKNVVWGEGLKALIAEVFLLANP